MEGGGAQEDASRQACARRGCGSRKTRCHPSSCPARTAIRRQPVRGVRPPCKAPAIRRQPVRGGRPPCEAPRPQRQHSENPTEPTEPTKKPRNPQKPARPFQTGSQTDSPCQAGLRTLGLRTQTAARVKCCLIHHEDHPVPQIRRRHHLQRLRLGFELYLQLRLQQLCLQQLRLQQLRLQQLCLQQLCLQQLRLQQLRLQQFRL